MPIARPGNRNESCKFFKTRRYKNGSVFKSMHLYGVRPKIDRVSRAGIRGRNYNYEVSVFFSSRPISAKGWRNNEFKEYEPDGNVFVGSNPSVYSSYGTLNMKIRPRLIRRRLQSLKETSRIERRNILDRNMNFISENTITDNVMKNGAGAVKKMKGENIHHFTEEYYLPYLVRDYDFSLTHNDLLSIDKDHIPVVINMLEEYFIKFNDPELKLRHVELIDHNVYMNKLFLFSFSKVFIIAKMNSRTNPTNVYVTEFIAFSKYPNTEIMDKMISEVSSMIYKSLVARDLNTNLRLIDMNSELDTETTFCKFVSDGKNVSSHDIRTKTTGLSASYYPYLDVQLLMDEYSKSDDKLLILYGENGSGKTKLSTVIACNLYANSYNVIVCSGADVDNTALLAELEDKIYSSANKLKHVAVIIDDLDPKFLNRSNSSSETNIFFNKLLTILDGNFDINLKFIITTNHILREEADEPLYRSGRLFDSIYIRYLTPDEAKSILKDNGMKTKDITDFLSDKKDKVKQSDLAQFIRMAKTKISRKYRLDSTGDNFKTKKVGFVK